MGKGSFLGEGEKCGASIVICYQWGLCGVVILCREGRRCGSSRITLGFLVDIGRDGKEQKPMQTQPVQRRKSDTAVKSKTGLTMPSFSFCSVQSHRLFYLPPTGVQSIAMAMSVCLSVCSLNWKTTRRNFANLLRMLLMPWYDSPLAALRCVTYFRFCG